jgi:hypothetical protein
MARQADGWKRKLWQRRSREFDRGSETVADFCDRVGVSVATFYLWRRKLKAALQPARSPAPAAGSAPMRPATPARRRRVTREATAAGMTFLPVEISGGTGVEVWLPDGTRINVPCHQRAALRTVIATLLRASRGNRQTEPSAC